MGQVAFLLSRFIVSQNPQQQMKRNAAIPFDATAVVPHCVAVHCCFVVVVVVLVIVVFKPFRCLFVCRVFCCVCLCFVYLCVS